MSMTRIIVRSPDTPARNDIAYIAGDAEAKRRIPATTELRPVIVPSSKDQVVWVSAEWFRSGSDACVDLLGRLLRRLIRFARSLRAAGRILTKCAEDVVLKECGLIDDRRWWRRDIARCRRGRDYNRWRRPSDDDTGSIIIAAAVMLVAISVCWRPGWRIGEGSSYSN
jgi:hypothetical protein